MYFENCVFRSDAPMFFCYLKNKSPEVVFHSFGIEWLTIWWCVSYGLYLGRGGVFELRGGVKLLFNQSESTKL